MPGVLDGIRVVDWSILQVGPIAAALLGDLGADVIHIEELGKGDRLRGLKTASGGIPMTLPGGRHISFEEQNRNKKSLAIDLKKPQGREVLYRLISKSDVFITNLREKIIKQCGMDYQTLSGYNPKLIYASSSGLGLKGPDAELPVLDVIGCARSGLMWASSSPESDVPVMLPLGLSDRLTGWFLAYATLVAILARERLGIGQEVKSSMLGAMVAAQAFPLMLFLLGKGGFPRHSRTKPGNALWNYYRCQDGRWIVMAMQWQEQLWLNFCKVTGLERLLQDPRFTTFEERLKNAEALVKILDAVFATKTCDEWCAMFKKNDFLFSQVNTYEDVAKDEQARANGYITTWDHPTLGPIDLVGFPFEFSKTPMTIRTPAPEYAQHTEEVMTEICGYSWEEITRLKDEGVI